MKKYGYLNKHRRKDNGGKMKKNNFINRNCPYWQAVFNETYKNEFQNFYYQTILIGNHDCDAQFIADNDTRNFAKLAADMAFLAKLHRAKILNEAKVESLCC